MRMKRCCNRKRICEGKEDGCADEDLVERRRHFACRSRDVGGFSSLLAGIDLKSIVRMGILNVHYSQGVIENICLVEGFNADLGEARS